MRVYFFSCIVNTVFCEAGVEYKGKINENRYILV